MKEIQIANVGSLKLYTIENPTAKINTIIAGNAYGIMPYVRPIAEMLFDQNIQPFWFAFSGQEGTEGVFSHKQSVVDLKAIIKFIKSNYPNKKLSFLAHCVGSLITLEYLKETQDKDVEQVVIYGLLYNMGRRRLIAEKRLKISGVNYNHTDEEWAYNPLKAIESCNANILFCHAKDKLNLERATEQEMELALKIQPNNKIKWFEKGYDDDDAQIDNYINTYVSFLKGEKKYEQQMAY